MQNSVCEGEITPANYDELKSKSEEIAKAEESVILYVVTNDSWFDREVIGDDPMDDSMLI